MKFPRIAASRTCAARHLRESIEIGFEETAAALSWRSEQSTGVPRNEASRMVQSAWSVGLQLSRLIAVIRRRNFVRIPPIRTRQPLGRCRSGPYPPLEAAA
jgi:hypothetical protein